METLYRKYRSQTFGELVGQKQATQILRNAIRRQRLSHAYLFTGPRGTGKTSVARIFAKALCCLDPRDGDCCGVCDHCVQIARGQALDVQEIDAASKNKVDDIRELRDRVGYAPAQFPYKIYIIDEVHMVTPQGFNALLKTLEEPPAHVKFLLCTTEAHKLPVTILSRCIRLDFTRIALPELGAHLQWIAAQEGFTLDEDAGLELAGLAEGSARDAISLLDQLTVYCEGSITRADVRELFQLGDPDLVPSIVRAIEGQQQRELLDTWERLAGQGADAGRFLLQVADALKQQYIESGNPAWRRALEAVWQGLNLLKQESFPALLVELSLLQAAEAFAAPPAAAVGAPATRESDPAPRSSGYPPAASAGSSAPGRKPEFLRKPREDAPAAQVRPAQSPASALPPVISSETHEPLPPEPQHLPDFEDAQAPVVQQERPITPSATASPAAVEPPAAIRVPAPDIPNPALADPRFAAYLAALRPLSLPAYALASQYARPELRDGVLELGFDPHARWARQACAYAQFPELMEMLAAAAESYGTSRLRVGITGEEAGWKKHGFPFDLGAPATDSPAAGAAPRGEGAAASPGSGAHALFARKAGKPMSDELEAEPEPDEEQISGGSPRRQPDPRELEADMEQLGRQMDKAAQAPVANPATVEDVLDIFGGRILED